ncbi:MAG: polysaccharide deacetylase family protein [Aquificota bacterium]|jgi:peptidoglycan/xylan/chitin deacetylase (PgdA/CDA1 family)|nr:polysaccharide deacetylase family protein [Aquificaceae bacterium]QWK13584.1 MAG: polysaccharide deacetylase family protein [Aquificota bacterium]HCO39083.1 polysaccharide deacetylase [Aquificaceae bacterium]
MIVLLYHKVIKYPSFDLWWKTFDVELGILKRFFRVISLDEVIEILNSGKDIPKRTVAITFDDGYADNYIYAYPLLKKHGLRATIFVASSRIIREDYKRKSLEDYWNGKASLRELYGPKSMHEANLEFLKDGISQDFLTQEELRAMQDVFDIGWHSKHHTKDFYSEDLLGFYDGKGHWSLMHAYGEEPKLGFPIFPMKGSLSIRVGKLRKEVKDFINSLPRSFFERKEWKKDLKEELFKHFERFLDFESEEERLKRVKKEIEEAKKELEELIGGKIYHSAYPFGDYDKVFKEEVSKSFLSAFTTEKRTIKQGDDPYLLPRITVPKDLWSFFAILARFR